MKKEIQKCMVEVTDTFGGESNYSWVRRDEIRFRTQRGMIKAAKKFAGWTGIRCRKVDFGETVALYPQGMCQVMFIG